MRHMGNVLEDENKGDAPTTTDTPETPAARLGG